MDDEALVKLMQDKNKEVPKEDNQKTGVVELKILSGFSIRVYPGGRVYVVQGSQWTKMGDSTYYKKKQKSAPKKVPVTKLKTIESY